MAAVANRLKEAVRRSGKVYRNEPISVFVQTGKHPLRSFEQLEPGTEVRGTTSQGFYEDYLPTYLPADLLYDKPQELRKSIFETVGRPMLRKAENLRKKFEAKALKGDEKAAQHLEHARLLVEKANALFPKAMGSAVILFDKKEPEKVFLRLKPVKEGFGGLLDKFGGFSKVGESPAQTLERKIAEEIHSPEPLSVLPFRVFISGIATNESTFMHYAVAPPEVTPKEGEGYWVPLDAVKEYLMKKNPRPLQEHLADVGMTEEKAREIRLNPHLAAGLRAWFLKEGKPTPSHKTP